MSCVRPKCRSNLLHIYPRYTKCARNRFARAPRAGSRRQEHGTKSAPGQAIGFSLDSVVAPMLLALVLNVSEPAFVTDPAYGAVDNKQVGTCVLRNCQKALAGCLGDATCLENLVCLQACNGAEDETSCQIKCGDKYQDAAIDTFNKCAVSEEKCVPQRVDEGLYPVPPDCALDTSFDLGMFQGRWYITAGLNPLFDTVRSCEFPSLVFFVAAICCLLLFFFPLLPLA
jgi:hypothetical protein